MLLQALRMTTAAALAEEPVGKAWHSQSAEVLAQLGSAATGLSSQEAAQRLAANGPNELKEGKRIRPWQIFFGQFKSRILNAILAKVLKTSLISFSDSLMLLAVSTVPLLVLEARKLFIHQRVTPLPA